MLKIVRFIADAHYDHATITPKNWLPQRFLMYEIDTVIWTRSHYTGII